MRLVVAEEDLNQRWTFAIMKQTGEQAAAADSQKGLSSLQAERCYEAQQGEFSSASSTSRGNRSSTCYPSLTSQIAQQLLQPVKTASAAHLKLDEEGQRAIALQRQLADQTNRNQAQGEGEEEIYCWARKYKT